MTPLTIASVSVILFVVLSIILKIVIGKVLRGKDDTLASRSRQRQE